MLIKETNSNQNTVLIGAIQFRNSWKLLYLVSLLERFCPFPQLKNLIFK